MKASTDNEVNADDIFKATGGAKHTYILKGEGNGGCFSIFLQMGLFLKTLNFRMIFFPIFIFLNTGDTHSERGHVAHTIQVENRERARTRSYGRAGRTEGSRSFAYFPIQNKYRKTERKKKKIREFFT